MAIVVSIANQKGGVGKTACTVNLARALIDEGRRVLVIDSDPQSSLSIAHGIDPHHLRVLDASGKTYYFGLVKDEPLESLVIDGSSTRLRYLFTDNGQNRLMTFGRTVDARFELVGFDLEKRTIWLVTSPYERTNPPPKPEDSRHCRGDLGPEHRQNHYSICNSRFAIRVGAGVSVDTANLRRVLEESNLMGVIAEERLLQYRADFADARTEGSLADFAMRYRDDDPEGLGEQARHRLPAQRLEDYRAAFKRAMESQLPDRSKALDRFIADHRGYDPERLIPRANEELAQLAALERQELEQVGEQGTTICKISQGTGPKPRSELGWIKMVGYTENSTASKLKVQVNQIIFFPYEDPSLPIVDMSAALSVASVAIGQNMAFAGKLGWFDRIGWKTCK